MIAGLIGRKLGYSYSARIFEEYFSAKGLRGQYRLLEFEPDELEYQIRAIKSNDEYIGCNVTIPYKRECLKYLDEIEEVAAEIGSVNCLFRKGDKLAGTNTDYSGFLASLRRKELTGYRNILVLGGGGAAAAVVYALRTLTAENIYFWNRSEKRQFGNTKKWRGEKAEMVVNCTPVGTLNFNGVFPEEIYEAVSKAELYYDLVYNPAETEMALFALSRGVKTVNGLTMLVEQASKAAEYWFKEPFPGSFKDNIEKKLNGITGK
jgi:shikimate dehydrogenase